MSVYVDPGILLQLKMLNLPLYTCRSRAGYHASAGDRRSRLPVRVRRRQQAVGAASLNPKIAKRRIQRKTKYVDAFE